MTSYDASEFDRKADQLVRMIFICMISAGLHAGANAVLPKKHETDQERFDHHHFELINGYRQDAALGMVIGATAIIGTRRDKVSLQWIYRELQKPACRNLIIERAQTKIGPILSFDEKTQMASEIEAFEKRYQRLFEKPQKLQSRLMHVRDVVFAHGSIEQPTFTVTYSELLEIVNLVIQLGIHLRTIARVDLALYENESDYYARRAREMFEIVIATH